MDMFTSYGHIKKPRENYRFVDDFSPIVCLFKILHQNRVYDMTIM